MLQIIVLILESARISLKVEQLNITLLSYYNVTEGKKYIYPDHLKGYLK